MTHRPLVGITTFFAIGIFTNYLVEIPSFIVLPTIFLAIIVCTFLFIFHSCQNAAGPVRSGVLTLLILIFLTGILYHHFRSNSNLGNNISNVISTEKILIHLRGVIISPPIDKYVQGLPLSSVVKHRKKMSNFLLRVEAVASVLSANNIKVLSEGNGNYFFTFVYSLKKQLNAVIERHVKEGSIPLVNSILLGDREKVPENLMDGFLQTGTIHFLAISGLHVGILVISLHCLLRLFRFNIRYLAIIIILVVFLYAAITGMKSPIIRAGIMVAVYYGTFIVNRRWDLPNSIAAAVFIILLINPSDLFNVGFQLSVLAVLGIVYCSNRLENFFWKSTLLVEKLQAKEERNEP